MPQVEIRCPTCKKSGFIEINEENMKDISGGLIAINIASNAICSHSIVAYIDKNFSIRDLFTLDFQIEIPVLLPKDKVKDISAPEKKILDLDLIKLNLPATLLCNVLKSIFLKKKIVIISPQKFLNEQIFNFFKYITMNSFNADISVILKEEYKKKGTIFKDSMVFEDKYILRNLNKLIDPKTLKVEKEIVNRFLSEYELGNSYILLKNEIYKAFLLSKSIVDFANNYSKNEELNSNEVMDNSIITSIVDGVVNREKFISNLVSDHLEKKFNVKVQKNYLNFLFDIVENYFEIDLKNAITII